MVEIVCSVPLVVIAASFAPTGVRAEVGLYSKPRKPNVVLRIANTPSNEDATWPITRVDSWQSTDSRTGTIHFHKTIIRTAPAGYVSPSHKLVSCASDGITAPSVTCNYRSYVSRTDQDIQGPYTANIVHYLNNFCSSDYGCTHYQPVRLEVWWTKSTAGTPSISYTTDWGCGNCAKCNDSRFQYIYHTSGTMRTWNGNKSSVLIYTTSIRNWPALRAFPDLWYLIAGHNTSNTSGYNMDVAAGYP